MLVPGGRARCNVAGHGRVASFPGFAIKSLGTRLVSSEVIKSDEIEEGLPDEWSATAAPQSAII